jgi:hypothetical protein
LSDELQDDDLGCVIIARNWQGDAPGHPCRLAQFEKVSGVNVIERFDHRPAKLLLDPPALRQAGLDRLDAAVALAWVIIAGINDDHPVRRICEQTGREVRNILLRNGNHDEVHAANSFWDRDSGRAGFGGQVGERFGTSRVCDKNLVSKRGEAAGQCAANLACADDADLHVFILRLDRGTHGCRSRFNMRNYRITTSTLGKSPPPPSRRAA